MSFPDTAVMQQVKIEAELVRATVWVFKHPCWSIQQLTFEYQGQFWVMQVISGTLITSGTLACVYHFVFKLF